MIPNGTNKPFIVSNYALPIKTEVGGYEPICQLTANTTNTVHIHTQIITRYLFNAHRKTNRGQLTTHSP